ncbi:hypothetical protein [Cupriavidus sp. TMH.W2]|uniref:hypothetical protein n=1 Tax=Cupriavidus sp. TMH.W2 TaxID=3434465 RepID=UPI003D77412D
MIVGNLENLVSYPVVCLAISMWLGLMFFVLVIKGVRPALTRAFVRAFISSSLICAGAVVTIEVGGVLIVVGFYRFASMLARLGAPSWMGTYLFPASVLAIVVVLFDRVSRSLDKKKRGEAPAEAN